MTYDKDAKECYIPNFEVREQWVWALKEAHSLQTSLLTYNDEATFQSAEYHPNTHEHECKIERIEF